MSQLAQEEMNLGNEYMKAVVDKDAYTQEMTFPDLKTMAPIKLVALDLDGTTLREDKTFSPRLIKTIHALQDRGVCVAICSGRAPESIYNFAKDLKLDGSHGYCICFNGGAIINLKDIKQDIYSATLNAQDLIDIEAAAVAQGCVVHAYSTRRVLLTESDIKYTQMEIVSSKQPFERLQYPDDVRADEHAYKLIAVEEEEQLDKMRAHMPVQFSQRFTIARTHPNFLEFMTHGCSKGSSLVRLCELLGITPENVAAFGDAENDIEMVQVAGVGVAVANAMPALKKVAKYTTLNYLEDGVALYLEHLFNL